MAGGVFGGLVLLSSAYHPLLFNSPDLPPDFSKSPLRLILLRSGFGHQRKLGGR